MKKSLSLFSLLFCLSIIALPPSPCQIVLISTSGTNAQTLCQSTAIAPITYSVSGTSASVAGLPSGLTSNYNANVFTISGTPSVSGIFNYTITTTGGCSPDAMAVGSITVNPLPIAGITGNFRVCRFSTYPNVIFYGNGGAFPYTMHYTNNGVLDTITLSVSDTILLPVSTSDTGKFTFALINVSDSNGCYGQIQNDSATVTVENCIPRYTTVYDTLQNTFILTLDSLTVLNAKSYYWSFGDGSTSTLVTPTHTYTNDTTYMLCLQIAITSGGVSKSCHLIGKGSYGNIYRTSGFKLNVVAPQLQTGIENNMLNENTSIYPNPFNNQLSIVTDKPSFVKITTINGTEVYNAKVNAGKSFIDTNGFSTGIYFITITNEQTTVTKKLVKE